VQNIDDDGFVQSCGSGLAQPVHVRAEGSISVSCQATRNPQSAFAGDTGRSGQALRVEREIPICVKMAGIFTSPVQNRLQRAELAKCA
jgi:hypothetical protein